jgi:GTP-binding protein Era
VHWGFLFFGSADRPIANLIIRRSAYLLFMTRAGFVTLVGRPNAGKSTLLNRLIGQKLSIVSPKPQSTRDRVVGILTKDDAQLVLLDTPGLLDPQYELQRTMRAVARGAIEDADAVLHLIDATEPQMDSLVVAAGLDAPPKAPVIIAFNKIDRLKRDALAALAASHPDAIQISAANGDGIETLVTRLAALLPESPFLYDAEDVSTQHLRYFVAELIRETALEQLEDEIPYSVAVGIEEFREDRSPVYIRAVVYLERDSQKRIFIGTGGSRIKDIGKAARQKIERLVGATIYLDLWVKVLPNWRKDPSALARLGYHIPDKQKR